MTPSFPSRRSSDLTDYANIVLGFQAAYAIGYLGFGRRVDKIGARLGYAFAFTLWTVAHILHGAVRTTFGFGAVRFMLGIGESGSFPAGRSEEHTSELQSLMRISYAVFCLKDNARHHQTNAHSKLTRTRLIHILKGTYTLLLPV